MYIYIFVTEVTKCAQGTCEDDVCEILLTLNKTLVFTKDGSSLYFTPCLIS